MGNKRISKQKKSQAGVTLMELVVVIVVIGIVASVTQPMVSMGLLSYMHNKEHREFTNDADRVYLFLQSKMKHLNTLTTINPNRFVFESEGVEYDITYQVDPEDPLRSRMMISEDSGTASPIIDGLNVGNGFFFSYYNQDREISNNLNDISLIKTTLNFRARYPDVGQDFYTYNFFISVQNINIGI